MRRAFCVALLVFWIDEFGVLKGNALSNVCPTPPIEVQNKVKFVPDLEQCDKINKDYSVNENYNFINYFGNIFDTLMKGIDSLVIPNKNTKMNVIFFIGNTGSGKSTSLQVLAGDNTKVFSKPVREGSDDYIIADYSKIGTDTITSETLYPDIIVDQETGYVFCDNPGFRDTRSSIHEIVSMYSMRKVLKYTDKIKLVLVTTRASLKVGMYRDDFLNTLKHVSDFIHDVQKYENSIFLLGTKVENTYVKKNGRPEIVSDDAVITDIGFYLNEVKSSLKGRIDALSSTENKKEIYEKSVKIIERILEKNDDKYSRISILRRPDDVGPISGIQSLQDERRTIRSKLLTDENFVSVNYNDFGMPLTDSALLFLSDLFVKMNAYMTDFSKLINMYLMNRYESYINSNTDINSVIEQIIKIKESTREFSNDIGISKDPGQFIDTVSKFSNKNNLKLDCLGSFKNISKINEFLSSLDDLKKSNPYNPLSWNMTMKLVNDFVEKKLEEYSFLKDVFGLFSDYKSQHYRNLYNVRDIQHWGLNNKERGLEINKNNFKNFIEKVNLNNRYSLITAEQGLINKVNSIINVALKHENKIICKDDTLTIVDYYVVLSELDGKYPTLCSNANNIVIFALHTIFIDKDLTGNWFNGKMLTIVAPVWSVIGSRTINVEGQSGGIQLPKANNGEIGRSGQSGRPGGIFTGIGQIFNNGENLVVNVRGGDGQYGQDGGDGLNGANGAHAEGYDEGYHHGQPGGIGGDSGSGGKGGFGGQTGFIYMYNIGREEHRIQFVSGNGRQGSSGRNGIPGIGGDKGCDLRIKVHRSRFLGIVTGKEKTSSFVNCGGKSRSGNLRIQIIDPIQFPYPKIPVVQMCTHIDNFKKYYDSFRSLLSDGISTSFINRMVATKFPEKCVREKFCN